MKQPSQRINEWTTRLSEVARIHGKNTNLSMFGENIVNHFSLPAFDVGQGPDVVPSNSIRSNKIRISEPCVLFSKLNPRINRVWQLAKGEISERVSVCSTEFVPLVADSTRLSPGYLKYLLRSPQFRRQVDHLVSASTNSRQRIRPQALLAATIKLPELAVQHRVTKMLDDQLAVIEDVTKFAKDQLGYIGALRESVKNAFWDSLSDVKDIPLHSVCDFQSGPAFKSSLYTKKGVNLLRNANIAPGRIDWGETVYLSEAQSNAASKYLMNPGDIVLTMDRPFISSGLKVAKISEVDVPSVLNQRTCRFQPSSVLDSEFLYFFVQSGLFRSAIEGHDFSVGVPHISLKQIGNARIPLPSLSVQRKFVQRISEQLSDIDSLKDKCQSEIADVALLEPATIRFGLDS
jgi:type I restriction enzyme S subunit